MESVTVTFRVPAALMDACKAKAAEAGLSVPLWLRSLAEKETGVAADPKPGASGLSERKRRKIAKHAAEARWARDDESE